MELNILWLQNFRNHQNLIIDLNSRVTLILGPNGSGKSNVLEAIYLLATGRSHRADKIEQMIKWNEEIGRVKGVLLTEQNTSTVPGADKIEAKPINHKNTSTPYTLNSASYSLHTENNDNKTAKPQNCETNLQATLTRGQVQGKPSPLKTLQVNDIPRSLRKFAGCLRAVLFNPADMRLIEGSPARRRNFLDDTLTQTFPEYYRSLLSYTKALRRRNKILQATRDHHSVKTYNHTSLQQLYFWDKLLVKEGNIITEHRQKFIDFINIQEGKKSWDLDKARQIFQFSTFQINYYSNPISPERLQLYLRQSLATGATLIGPHRDDFTVSLREIRKKNKDATIEQLNDKTIDLSTYGSRGQQRLAILRLKLGALDFIHKQTHERPILLLDDIFSELDHNHRLIISQVIQNQQTIITAADTHLVVGIPNPKIIELT